MNNLVQMTLIMIVALCLNCHLARASANGTIQQMERLETEMLGMQDRIDELSNGDSQGRLSAAGQLIDEADTVINEAKKMYNQNEEALQAALDEVKELHLEVQALLPPK